VERIKKATIDAMVIPFAGGVLIGTVVFRSMPFLTSSLTIQPFQARVLSLKMTLSIDNTEGFSRGPGLLLAMNASFNSPAGACRPSQRYQRNNRRVIVAPASPNETTAEKRLREQRKEEEVWQFSKTEVARRLEENERRRMRGLIRGLSKRMPVASGVPEFGERKYWPREEGVDRSEEENEWWNREMLWRDEDARGGGGAGGSPLRGAQGC